MTAIELLIESIRVYADLVVGEQFWATSARDISNRFLTASTKEAHLALNSDRFNKYVSDVLERDSDCYFTNFIESEEIEPLEKSIVFIIDEEEQREAMCKKMVNCFGFIRDDKIADSNAS